MKIAILGTRGIPANYGGFETFAEECAARLVERGHDVTVYGRAHYVPPRLRSHRNVSLVVLPTVRSKYADTLVHTFLSVLHAIPRRFDVILMCNAANSIYAGMPRLFGAPVVVNVDGIERLRRKWNWLGKAYCRLCEYLSTKLPNAIVTDARVIQTYYRERYGAKSHFIPYGAVTTRPDSQDALRGLNLQSGEYFLYVSRFEPENNAHVVVQAFERVSTKKRLVAVGDAPYSGAYISQLKQTKDLRILFPGAIYGTGYWELQANAFCYIHATDVGGTHPALIEAMGQGNVIIANGTPENVEVLGSAGLFYRKNDPNDLARCIQDVADDPAKFAPLKEAARARAMRQYSWDGVVGQYEALFEQLLRPDDADGRRQTTGAD